MKFEDMMKLLELELKDVNNSRGYFVVSIERKNEKSIYDKDADSILLNLRTDDNKPLYIGVHTLAIQDNAPERISLEFKKENGEYSCDIHKYV